jgi:hypothetical protein
MSAASAKTQDPSMEEILASIRRIIADDQEAPPPANAGASPPAKQADEEESVEDQFRVEARGEPEPAPEPVFEAPRPPTPEPPRRDAPPAPPAPPAAQPERAERPSPPPLDIALDVPELSFGEVADAKPSRPALEAAPPVHAEPAKPAPSDSPLENLISTEATATVGQAFNMLSSTVLSRNSRTLEDLVKEMLKPMLKVWLDDNLPPLVERLVRAEIERVARGGS